MRGNVHRAAEYREFLQRQLELRRIEWHRSPDRAAGQLSAAIGDLHRVRADQVFAANGSAVDTTIVDGQVLMRGRTVLTMDEALVLREANRALTRVTAAIGWGR